MNDIEIRPVNTMEAMRTAVQLQEEYWGKASDALVPAHMLYSLVKAGGHVLGAFDEERMIGLVLGFLGTDVDAGDQRPAMAKLIFWSKRMVVLPAYRGLGIANRLKLAQRDVAIQQGIRLIRWTFDPVYTLNAHLNIRKLGGVSTKFVPNYFGKNNRNPAMNTDRLVIDWWVTHRRVEKQLNGTRSSLNLFQYLEAGTPIVNLSAPDDRGILYPTDIVEMIGHSMALVEAPLDFSTLETIDNLGYRWRMNLRAAFALLMERGYIVTDFLRAEYQGYNRAFYLLSHDAGFAFRWN